MHFFELLPEGAEGRNFNFLREIPVGGIKRHFYQGGFLKNPHSRQDVFKAMKPQSGAGERNNRITYLVGEGHAFFRHKGEPAARNKNQVVFFQKRGHGWDEFHRISPVSVGGGDYIACGGFKARQVGPPVSSARFDDDSGQRRTRVSKPTDLGRPRIDLVLYLGLLTETSNILHL